MASHTLAHALQAQEKIKKDDQGNLVFEDMVVVRTYSDQAEEGYLVIGYKVNGEVKKLTSEKIDRCKELGLPYKDLSLTDLNSMTFARKTESGFVECPETKVAINNLIHKSIAQTNLYKRFGHLLHPDGTLNLDTPEGQASRTNAMIELGKYLGSLKRLTCEPPPC